MIQPRLRLRQAVETQWNPTNPPQVLCLSNGHGEDEVGSRLAVALVQLGIPVQALPIVGEGKAYQRQGIPLLPIAQVMPSGGFIYQDWRQL